MCRLEPRQLIFHGLLVSAQLLEGGVQLRQLLLVGLLLADDLGEVW